MNHPAISRRSVLGAAALASALALTGCSGGGSADGGGLKTPANALKDPTTPVTITYAGAAYAADQIKPVLDAFEKAHPTIKVKYESVPFDDFNSVLAARLTNSSNAIDIFDVDMPRTSAYAARGWLADLTSTFPGLKTSVDPASLAATTVGGKLVAMPYQTSTNLMYYNKKLLKAAGINAPSADPAQRLTWEAVLADAQKAKKAGAQYGVVFDQIDRYYQLEPLMLSAGGGPGAKGAGNLTPDVTNPGWIKAMQWYGDLFKQKLSPRGVAVADTSALFSTGKTAFYVGGPWWGGSFAGVKDLDFGVTAFPAFEGGKAATPTGGWGLGLNPRTTDEKAAAGAIFMKFMGLDNGGYAQYLSALVVPPSNLSGSSKFYENPTFQDPRFEGVTDLIKYELANTAALRLKSVGYVEFEDVLTKTFDDIINGTSADQALRAASTQLNDAWAKYRK